MSTTNKRSLGRKEARAKREVQARADDIRHVMSAYEGRRFMYDLVFRRLGLMDVYPGADSGIYRHEGKRQAAVQLAVELQQEHAETYIQMITERMQDQAKEAAARDADSDQEDGDDE